MATTKGFTFTTTNIAYNSTSDDSDYDFEYDDDYEDQRCDRMSTRQIGATFTTVFFSIVVILSLFGNILVIVIVAKYENLKSLTSMFILNLALSDLLFTAGLPFWVEYHLNGWTLGEPACKAVTFIFYVGFYSSGFLLILMTIYRFIAVINPLSDMVSTKGFCSILATPVIWTVSMLFASPALIFTKVQSHKHCVPVSSNWALWGIYQQNILFILSSVIFIFCYSQIICTLLRPTAQRRKSKTLKIIFILMVVFFVGWAPYNIVIFLKSFHFWPQTVDNHEARMRNCETLKQLEYAFYVCRLFAYSHCCLNPVFYVFIGVKFKNHLKKMLKGWGRNRNSIQSRQSRLTITSLTSGEDFCM